jgi:hypothetical protein
MRIPELARQIILHFYKKAASFFMTNCLTTWASSFRRYGDQTNSLEANKIKEEHLRER